MPLTPGMGMGMGGDHLGPQIQKNHKTTVRTKIVHTSGICFEKMFKNIFKICSYIQKATPNPINLLKIIIYNAKRITNTKIHVLEIKQS